MSANIVADRALGVGGRRSDGHGTMRRRDGEMERGVPRRGRARPVVGAGVESLLRLEDELAKGWLLALIEDAPLAEAGAIMTEDLARDGPRICRAVVRALSDDAELRRLEPGGALEPVVSRAGEFAGAGSAEEAAGAVEALREVVWGALRMELARSADEILADAAERLSLVVELVRSAVLRRFGDGEAFVGRERRCERGAPVWVAALTDEIARAVGAEMPLSVLLVELEEAERMLAAASASEASATFGRFAQAVREAVRRRDVLAWETDSRAWVIARDTDRAGARALGSRIVRKLPAEHSWRGAPLTVNVGVAVLGEDGLDAAGLIDVAERTAFAAAASGTGIGGDG
jgi:GGDEF domain-containing protein